MPSLILHIGAPKTGTSYLQVLFARYADELRQNGVHYPSGFMFEDAKSGKITSGNGVEMANYIRPNLPHQIPNKDKFIDKLRCDIAEAEGADVLYSCEFLQFDSSERSQQIALTANELNYNVRVVCFVRDLGPGAFSTYSQQLKRHGETRPFEAYLREWDPHHKLLLLNAEQLFGRKAIEVYNFDEKRDVLANFFFTSVLGSKFVPDEPMKVNRSLSQMEAELVRHMNSTFAAGDMRLSEFISNALMATEPAGDDSFAITKSENDFLMTKFEDALTFINKFMRGRPIGTAQTIVDSRPPLALSPVEYALLAIVARLVARVNA